MYAARELAKLGYEFIAGPSGSKSDLILRKKGDAQRGFEWNGQSSYDALGDAVVAYVQAKLCGLCELVPLPFPSTPSDAYTAVYASDGLLDHTGPILLLVCGSAPGGACGIWGRSLCINESLLQGAMLDYVMEAQSRGWAVLIANPNVCDVQGSPVVGSECPHVHLRTLWRTYIEPSNASSILVVAHSYGAAAMVHLLKCEASSHDRIHAMAFTDGGAFPNSSILQEVVPSSEDVSASEDPSAAQERQALLQRYAEIAPDAFIAASDTVRSRLAAVGRNFAASQRPLGTLLAGDREGVPTVSAGNEDHAATTHAATAEVFSFLERGVAGTAAASNEELRTQWASTSLES